MEAALKWATPAAILVGAIIIAGSIVWSGRLVEVTAGSNRATYFFDQLNGYVVVCSENFAGAATLQDVRLECRRQRDR